VPQSLSERLQYTLYHIGLSLYERSLSPRETASSSYRERPDIEARFVKVELAERWLGIVCRALLVLLALALGAATIYCVLHGVSRPVPAGTGGSGALTGLASALLGRQE
jgi:hypothetical protein